MGIAILVESETLTLDATQHRATEEERYLVFKSTHSYELSRIQSGWRFMEAAMAGADRLSLVFANGHVHPLTSNNIEEPARMKRRLRSITIWLRAQ